MYMRSWKKKFGMVFLALLLAIGPPVMAAAESLEDARQEKENLENSLKEAQELIDSLEGSKENIQDKVRELDGKLTQISTDITNLEAKLETKNAEISNTQEVLELAQKDEKAQYESMKIRIRYMYENSRSSYVERLLSADSFSDFLSAVEYIRQISRYDRDMLEKYRETQNTVANAKTVLEADKAELEEMQAKVEEERQAVQKLLSAKETELASVDQNLDAANSQADAFAAEIEAQNEIIAQIQQAEAAKKAAREKAAAEAKARAEAEAAAAAAAAEQNGTEEPSEGNSEQSSEANPPEETEPVTEDTYDGGAFLWPCPSSRRVTSDYGNRVSPTAGASSNHKGIDIGAAYGADIVAAADGTIIFAGYSNSGGNYVMIDHGGSLYTVYMHASSLCVSNGQKVTGGQIIAKVGSTGISTGNHLHFGVSLNGSYVSPWNYLSR